MQDSVKGIQTRMVAVIGLDIKKIEDILKKNITKDENLCEGVLEYLQAEVEQRLRINVAPMFWKHFQNIKDSEDETNLRHDFKLL